MTFRLLHYTKRYWLRGTVAIICMTAVAAISTALIWLLKFLLDQALVQKDAEALTMGVVLILSGYALKSILWYVHTYLAAYISQSIARQLRDDTYRHLYSLSMGFFNQKTSSGIMARLTNDVTTLQYALVAAPTTIIRDGLQIIGLIGFLLYSNLKFSLICFSILPIVGYFLVEMGKKSRKAGRESQSKMADIYSTIQEAITAMPIVKTFQNEEKEINDLAKENRNFFNVMMRLARIDARSSPIMEFLGAIVLAVMIFIGGHDVVSGHWSLGGFVAFVGAAMTLYNPIKKFSSVNVQIQMGLAAAERVFELLDQKGTVLDHADATDAPTLSKGIEYSHVGFSYVNDVEVLDDVNFSLKKGEIIALVGSSGSGKSTIAQLLLRFYDPTSGSVLFDGRDMRELTVSSLRRQMAVVTQETHLFNDTIAANIAYGRPAASQSEVEDAAKAAYAHDFIAKLPDGYNSIIGERGTRLSGGERQRLAIARSLLKNPSILILDEATSALDAESEQAVQKAFDRLLEGRTVLMIAHRLSTVRKAHRIIVLENGKIKETGSHDELLTKKGTYHKLYQLQATI
jgi:subfamily B ATP-binding cassette protein MsbA